ncbi:MAG: hypothetical protein WCI30_05245 [Clostridia bacterium]
MKKLQPKELNLLQRYYAKELSVTKTHNNKLSLIFPILMIIAFLSISIVLYMQNKAVEQELKQVNSYLQNPQNMQQQTEAQALAAQLATLQQKTSILDEQLQSNQAQGKLTFSLYQKLLIAAGPNVKILALNYDGTAGSISLSVSAKGVQEPPSFIERLTRIADFAKVNYNGYNQGETEYQVEVEIQLQPTGGKV